MLLTIEKFKNIFNIITIFLFIIFISGCSGLSQDLGEGLARGLSSSLVDDSDNTDKRKCQVWSKGFKGIGQSVDKQEGKTKVLMVHGVGNHSPGYSTRLMENLANELNLDTINTPQKNLNITDTNESKKDLGNLRLTRLSSSKNNRELLFYELSWSSITEQHKKVLTFDQSGSIQHRRTKFNHMLKKLTNDALSDPMIYLGKHNDDIQISVAQSYCWMMSGDYNEFPNQVHRVCELKSKKQLERAKKDDFIFITHSLGSGITIDAMQRIARLINANQFKKQFPEISDLHDVIRNREITIFMLSNQLQLLQLGRDLPDVTNKIAQYCNKKGKNYSDRFADKTNIIAISDPNDILSYAVPQRYEDQYLDSRLCPEISNININIANLMNIFNLTEFANPLDAHINYDEDERVAAMLAYGLGNDNTREIVNDRCDWIRTIN